MKKKIIIALLLTLGSWLLKLWWQNTLTFYIIPKYNGLVLATSLFCFITGFLLIWKPHWHWHQVLYHTDRKTFFVFCFPLLLGISLAPQPLSNSTANQRGIDTNLQGVSQTVKESVFLTNSAERSFQDWVNILGQSATPEQYQGETVSVSGFLSGTQKEPLLSRFMLRCCAADARPISLRLKINQSDWKENQWVQVQGVLKTDTNTNQPMFINATSIKKIVIPENPYIY